MKCKICGEEFDSSQYYKDTKNAMDEHQMCFSCNFWREKVEQDAQQPPHKVAIIDGVHYYIDDENIVTNFRGFGGDKFVINFKDGRKVTTTNLWCGGEISEHWKPQFPNNADFDWQWKKIGKYNYLIPKDK